MSRGRTTNARMVSEVGESREAKIASLLAVGLGAEAIQSALERDATECIPANDPRRVMIKDCKPFDAVARQRLLEAIRSTRGQMNIENEQLNGIVDMNNGSAPMQSIENTELKNMRRRTTGEPAIDQMYGFTRYIWLKDDIQGRFKRGDYIPNWVPFDIIHQGIVTPENNLLLESCKEYGTESLTGTENNCFIEVGLPDSFISFWAGAPGVGKSRLGVAVTNLMNSQERLRSAILSNGGKQVEPRKVLYYNGEAEPSQFRQWCGTKVDRDLFLVHHGEMILTERLVEDCYKYQPWVVFIDSFQTLAEFHKGTSGQLRILSRLKLLKNDPRAGCPHIMIISQLTKAGDMRGSRAIAHNGDFVAIVKKYDRGEGCFVMECPAKNRAGATGKAALFKHTYGGIECISNDYRNNNPVLNLIQKIAAPPEHEKPEAIDPTMVPVQEEEDMEDMED